MALRVEWFDQRYTWLTPLAAGDGVNDDRVEAGHVAVLISNGEQGAVLEGERLTLMTQLREAHDALARMDT